MTQDWITTEEAAEISKYHSEYIRKLLQTGKVTGQKWGREWQISRSSLLAYIHKTEKLGAKRGPKSGS